MSEPRNLYQFSLSQVQMFLKKVDQPLAYQSVLRRTFQPRSLMALLAREVWPDSIPDSDSYGLRVRAKLNSTKPMSRSHERTP